MPTGHKTPSQTKKTVAKKRSIRLKRSPDGVTHLLFVNSETVTRCHTLLHFPNMMPGLHKQFGVQCMLIIRVRPWYVSSPDRTDTVLSRRHTRLTTKVVQCTSGLTHEFLLKGEAPPEFIPCDCPLTIKHLRIECTYFNDVRRRFYQVPSLQDLFMPGVF